MSWWLPHNFEKKRPFLMKRAKIIGVLRAFFDERDFIDVETPVLQVCPVMDAHIHAFQTDLKNSDLSVARPMYMQTSPEFDMKKLMVAGMSQIYQICHVFRNGESSQRHSPEFTMLEWYRAEADYHALMDDCVDMLRLIAETLGIRNYTHRGIESDPFKDWQRISVVDTFKTYAEINLEQYINDLNGFFNVISETDVRVLKTDSWEDMFHAVMAEKIEPHLGVSVPTILYDYPASMASLSRRKQDDPNFAERFELYVCGVELANAFSELTDAQEQRERCNADMALKQELYGETYPPDEEFFKALEYGLPESAGIALGIDRLVMLACGADDINDVLWAPVQVNQAPYGNSN